MGLLYKGNMGSSFRDRRLFQGFGVWGSGFRLGSSLHHYGLCPELKLPHLHKQFYQPVNNQMEIFLYSYTFLRPKGEEEIEQSTSSSRVQNRVQVIHCVYLYQSTSLDYCSIANQL